MWMWGQFHWPDFELYVKVPWLSGHLKPCDCSMEAAMRISRCTPEWFQETDFFPQSTKFSWKFPWIRNSWASDKSTPAAPSNTRGKHIRNHDRLGRKYMKNMKFFLLRFLDLKTSTDFLGWVCKCRISHLVDSIKKRHKKLKPHDKWMFPVSHLRGSAELQIQLQSLDLCSAECKRERSHVSRNPTTNSRGRLRLTIDVETLVSQVAIRHSESDCMENQDPDNPPIDSYRLGNRDVFYVPNFLSVSDMVIVSVQYSWLNFSGEPTRKKRSSIFCVR